MGTFALQLSLSGLRPFAPRRPCLLLLFLLTASTLLSSQAHAGRRSLRVDVGAWNAPEAISLGGGLGACPEAGWNGQVPIFQPAPTIYWGWVIWMDLEFRTSGFEGLDSFTCQTSKPYSFGADPLEYLNEAIFPPDEADLGAYIGANTDNAVHAIRYSFTGEANGTPYGRQWTFYFFSSGETVVSLHGVQPSQATYERIYDLSNSQYIWRAEDDPFWDGAYFCFYSSGGYPYYGGNCEPAPPPLPDGIFLSGFEEW